jgi:mono/diheme cytochrome c family protein
MNTRSMRLPSHFTLVASVLILFFFFSVAASLAAQHDAAAHHHPEAAKITSPVPANAASVAAGKKVYLKHCAECHGDAGKGDGEMGDELEPKPANLADSDWKHGSSDGEIFTVIRNGVKGTGMKAFSKKITVHQAWDVINYVRTLAAAPAKSH